MKLLLDTHSLLCAMSGDSRLSETASDAITDFDNEIYVSVVTVWEAATKFRKGKLPEAARLAADP